MKYFILTTLFVFSLSAKANLRCESVFIHIASNEQFNSEQFNSLIFQVAELRLHVDIAQGQGVLSMVDKLAAAELQQKTKELLRLSEGVYTREQVKEIIAGEIYALQNKDATKAKVETAARAEHTAKIVTATPLFKPVSETKIVDTNGKPLGFTMAYRMERLKGTQLIYVDTNKGPYVINEATGVTHHIALEKLKTTVLQSNNKLLAIDYEGQLMEVDLINPSVTKLTKFKGDFISLQPAFSTDGKYLSVKNKDTTKTYDTQTGRRVLESFVDPERASLFTRMFKHPIVGEHYFLNERVLLIHVESGYYLFDIQTGQTTKIKTNKTNIYGLRLLSDGHTLMAQFDKEIYRIDIKDVGDFDNKVEVMKLPKQVIGVKSLENDNTLYVRISGSPIQNRFYDWNNKDLHEEFLVLNESLRDLITTPIVEGNTMYFIEYGSLKVFKR
jgi:hypothetical protein